MADLFGKIKNLVGTLNKKPGSVLGIDISSSSIKVIQLRKESGKAILETYGELALGPYAGIEPGKATQLSPEKMAAALKDLMTEARVTTAECGVAIPLSSSLVNVISMPDVGKKKLQEMVPIEMRKYIPVSISEVVLDWRMIPRTKPDNDVPEQSAAEKGKIKTVDVLVVAIHSDTISRYQSIIKQAGLTSTFFEIEVFSTVRASTVGGPYATMILDMGAGATKIYIVEHRVLRQSHSINRGSQDLTLALTRSMGISSAQAESLKRQYGLMPDAPDPNVREVLTLVLDNILAEAHRVMIGYQKKYQQNIGTVVLAGGGAGLHGFDALVQEALQNQVTVTDPFAKVESPAFLADVLHEAGPEFAVAVGVALRRLEENG